MSHKTSVYASLDIEADGPAPVRGDGKDGKKVGNMLSLGVVVVDKNKCEVGSFRSNLAAPNDVHADPATMFEFWSKHQDQWKRATEGAVDPHVVFERFNSFLLGLEARHHVVWVAKPAAYDWQWLNTYWHQYKPAEGPVARFAFKAHCTSTLFWVYCEQRGIPRSDWAKATQELSEQLPHTHDALDDARQQACLFVNVARELGLKL